MKSLTTFIKESFDFKGFETTKKGFLVAKNHYVNGQGMYQEVFDELKNSDRFSNDAYAKAGLLLNDLWRILEDPKIVNDDPDCSEAVILNNISILNFIFTKSKCKDGLEAYEKLTDILQTEVYGDKYVMPRIRNVKKAINLLNIITDFVCILYKEKYKL